MDIGREAWSQKKMSWKFFQAPDISGCKPKVWFSLKSSKNGNIYSIMQYIWLEINHILFSFLMGISWSRIYQNFCVCRAPTYSIFHACQVSVTKIQFWTTILKERLTFLLSSLLKITVKNHCHRRSRQRVVRFLKVLGYLSGFCGVFGTCQLYKICNFPWFISDSK